MRLFVAVFPPEEIQTALAASVAASANASMRELGIPVGTRFTSPENIHLTLKFLGSVPRDSARDIDAALARVAQKHAPFELSPSGFGGFPSDGGARVLWAGVSGEVERLRGLASGVEDSLRPLGFETTERRGFSPHLTLARMKKPVSLNIPLARVEEERSPVAGFRVEEIVLVESETKNEGAVYKPLKTYPLAKT